MIKLNIIKEMEEKYKIEQKNIMKTTTKYCEKKQKIDTENYLTKKKIQKGNMEEIDIIICVRES